MDTGHKIYVALTTEMLSDEKLLVIAPPRQQPDILNIG